MQNYCSLCGAPIGENNPDGLGAECRKAIKEAKFKAFFSIGDNSLKYNFLISAKITKETFLKLFENTKFRSEFNKSFYETIKRSERVSKKQVVIMQDKIFMKDCNESEKMNSKIDEEKKYFFTKGVKDIVLSRQQIEVARRSIRNGKI